jgi:two-component system, NarL family, sensor kinase
MYSPSTQGIIVFIIGIVTLLLIFISFIVTIVYKYQQRQNAHQKDIEALKASHENTLLQSLLEMQEQTFQNISREIHDNIGQKLTLAKLHLNTLNFTDTPAVIAQVNDSISMLSEAINDLSDISRSMSSEIILSNGLIKALEFEAAQLQKSGLYSIAVTVTGSPIFMDGDTELVLFRIAQEAINNVIKHAAATSIAIHLHYNTVWLTMEILDNGKGFNTDEIQYGTGLKNIAKRTALLKGQLLISSTLQNGTQLKIQLPLYENGSAV